MLFKRKKEDSFDNTLESLLRMVDLNCDSKVFKEDGELNRRGRLLLKKTTDLISLIESNPFFFDSIRSLKEHCWQTFSIQYAGNPLETCKNVLLHFKKIGDENTSVYEPNSQSSNVHELTTFGKILTERFYKWCEIMEGLRIELNCDDFDKKISEILKKD